MSSQDGSPLPEKFLYRSTVEALQYLVHTRPEITFVVNKLCQILENLSTHWAAEKSVLQYLKWTQTLD